MAGVNYMRKKLAWVIGAGCTVGIIAAGGGIAAYADDGGSARCNDGNFCLFADAGYHGYMKGFPGNLGVSHMGDDMNDRTTAVWNRTGNTFCLYDNNDFQGDLLLRIGPGGSNPGVERWANDRTSSAQSC
jgi:hypothetical protein